MEDIVNQKMREFFQQKFNLAGDDSFFSLTSGASIPIDSDEFLAPEPTDGISINAVQEYFSDLVNVLPAYYKDLSKVGADELYSINEVYYQILAASKPKLSGQKNIELSDIARLFTEKKDEALKNYEIAKKGSDKNWDFTKDYPMTEADPESWFKEDSVVWKPYTLDVNLHAESSIPGNSLPVFKLKMDDASILQAEKKMTENSGEKNKFFTPFTKAIFPGKTNVLQVTDHRTANKKPVTVIIRDHRQNSPTITPGYTRRILTQLNTVAIKKDTTAKSINISFDYLHVRINRRRWLDSAFLNDPNWYYPGKSKGSFSLPPDQKGLEPSLFAIPMGIVMIKGLTITSDTWTEEDKKTFSQSISFSNFNILNANMDGNIIKAPGMQVWGWISRKLPVLPPQDSD